MDNRRKQWARIGILFLIISSILWLFLPAIPFLPLTIVQKTAVAAATLVLAEIVGWAGVVFAGPEAVKRIRSCWRFWHGRIKPDELKSPIRSVTERSTGK